jgi:arylsulfatase A-like enzyme
MLFTWLRAALIATALVAILEIALVAAVVSMAISSTFEALSVFLTAAGFLVLGALPMAGALYLFERYVFTRLPGALREPRIDVLVGVLLGAPIAVAVVTSLGAMVPPGDLEFPEPVAFVVRVVATAAVAFLAIVLCTAAPLFRRLQALAPRIMRAPILIAVVAMAASVLALVVAHYGLFSIHRVNDAGRAGLAAVFAATVAGRLLSSGKVPSRRTRWILASMSVVLMVGAGVTVRDPHSRFVLAAHLPTAGYIATLAGSIADIDGDGAPPRWLGGDDCDEGNAAIGPGIREVAGDGIDQDCRGGDATVRVQEPPRRYEGCAENRALDVLVITIDALRADAIGGSTSPNLVAFAKGAIVHTRAFSPSTASIPSITSMLGGRAVSDLIDGGNVTRRFRGEVTTSRGYNFGTPFPHRLREAGFRTAAINPFQLFMSGDLQRLAGFDLLNAYPHDHPVHGAKFDLMSAQIVDGILRSLGSRPDGQRLFMWAHIPDLHAPYLPAGTIDAPGDDTAASAYLRGLAYVDNQLGRLFMELEKQRLTERLVVVITSDHGEDLGQRGREGHGPNLFDESIHVPLVIAAPGCAARVLDTPVSVTSLAASLGLIVGVPIPGDSLAQDRPYAVAEAPYGVDHRRAIVSARGKLIVSVRSGGRVLFDLVNDPGETTDVYRTNEALRAELEGYYQDWLDRP